MIRPSCFIIGAKGIAIRCAELLQNEQFDLRGVLTDDEDFRMWALSRGIPFAKPGDWKMLEADSFDYLFSIFNVNVLPPSVLDLPAARAINFHDGPLPRYAGLYSPSWAILNREREHGVTWHEMVSEIDGGEILKQRMLKISCDETALSLIRSCSEAAQEAFKELICELKRGDEVGLAQNPSERTYFGKNHRPPAAAVLRWNQPAENLDALIRALDFGPFPNPLAAPKIWTSQGALIVKAGRLVGPVAGFSKPGTVVKIGKDEITVSTVTGAIALGRFTDFDGKPLTVAEATENCGFAEGSTLWFPDGETLDQLEELSRETAVNESFWRRRLKRSAPLEIIDVQRSSSPPVAVAHSFVVPEAVSTWCEQHSDAWTQIEFLMAALAIYCVRLTGGGAFDFKWPVADARVRRLEAVFSTYVPVSVALEIDRTLLEILAVIRAEIAITEKRLTYPRDLIARLRESMPKKEKEACIVILQREPQSRCDLSQEPIWIELPTFGRDVQVTFDSCRIDSDALERLFRGYVDFLSELAQNDAAPISSLPLVAKQRLPEWFSAGQTPLEKTLTDVCVHTLIEQQAARNPLAIAIQEGDRELTYGQLLLQTNRVAAHLHKLGIGADLLVAVWCERSIETIVALIGILRAGAAYLPIEPSTPRMRAEFILMDAKPKCVLTMHTDKVALEGVAVPVIDLDEIISQSEQEPLQLNRVAEPRHIAYCIYTSGTTGPPKGVLIAHRSLAHYANAAADRFGITQRDRVLQFASLNFDASFEEIFPCLLSGATLVLRSNDMLASPTQFLDACRQLSLTVLDLPTAYWRTLVEEMNRTGAIWPETVRTVIIGGESAANRDVNHWHQLQEPPRLWNTYGPTETTIVATWCELETAPDDPRLPVSIGVPVPGVMALVVDSRLQPLPHGAIGELVIGGLGLARGYLNRPELTKEKFLRHAFGDEPEQRYFRTGDRARRRSDGQLEFHGRTDQQVKVRGFRVEPGEIEAALSDHPDLQESAVVPRSDENGETFLAGFVVPQPGKSLSVESLRSWLRQRVPEHMVPAQFCLLSGFPLTAGGKIDRRYLREFHVAMWLLPPKYEAPTSDTEHALVKIWQDVLCRESIGVQDSFFALGGDSLRAVSINLRVKEHFGWEPSLAWLFESPTVHALALVLDSDKDSKEPAKSSDDALILEIKSLWKKALGMTRIGRYEKVVNADLPLESMNGLIESMSGPDG
jgi:amino acid adenylation domain-containing protein